MLANRESSNGVESCKATKYNRRKIVGWGAMLLPLRMMWDRVNFAREDADTTLFLHLLYTGEMLTKIVASAMVAAISDDRQRNRYNLIHGLLRADGLGDWSKALDDTLIGPASQHLVQSASEDRRSLTERFGTGTWQYEAVHKLFYVIQAISPEFSDITTKAALRQWFTTFAAIRNKTRGHGAPTPATCAALAPPLEESISLICANLPLLHRPWAHLRRNLSGKFRVIGLGNDMGCFADLRTSSGARAAQSRISEDGIYIDFDEPIRVDLIETNVDLNDFYFPNGAFKGRSYELLSLITDNRTQGDASKYASPAGDRPASETEGRGILDVVGSTWSNLPLVAQGYIERPVLESKLHDVLGNDRHPIVTLVGRGGIGKTSLALKVLTQIAAGEKFDAIFWFSARDIDLLPEGPKVVAPRVLTHSDMAAEFVKLLDPAESHEKGFRAADYFASSLTKSPVGGALLFVFDNFETVANPADLFRWIDTHVRLPNKVLITSRSRDFKADYPIEVTGMTEDEADKLMDATAGRLGISSLLTKSYKAELFDESDGHPYIMKVLLGEVAKAGKLVKVERIVAGKDEILDALFERTYAGLSPVAKRVFLTLCSWRSLVPQLALEAVLLRPSNEKMDVAAAIEELISSSFIERTYASDDTAFLDVALVAAVFGRRKLELTPMKAAIDADVEFLQQIGATSASGIRHGIKPRLERLFQNVASRVATGRLELSAVVPSLEFISRQYPMAWPMLAKLHEECGEADALQNAAECWRRFLEVPQLTGDQELAWNELARLYWILEDWNAAAQAKIRLCQLPDRPYSMLSNMANELNNLLRERHLALDSQEKRVLFNELASLMERRSSEANATDLSRLAWLFLHMHDASRALEIVVRGLSIDPDNEHCVRLQKRLEGY